MKKLLAITFICLLGSGKIAFANREIDFSLHKLVSGQANNTLLVIGGIQGDEPGGFNAASLLVTRYKIKKGNVWVVPNLNFLSIIKRTRGVFGDLNRKFATIKSTDPEFKTIEKIKTIILDKQVDLVLNHHDGSGYYRRHHIDRMHSPMRWGQSIIIDQERIESNRFGNLGDIARQVVTSVNQRLYSDEHVYHVNNTQTHAGNIEMSKTLTYFAIQNSKPAFGVEASKELLTHNRAYYHLCVLESYMDLMGIKYEKEFDLSPRGVKNAINNDVNLVLYDKKIFLDVGNARKQLGYFPLKKNSVVEFSPSNPITTILCSGDIFSVYYGNRRLTSISPEYFEYDSSIDSVTMRIDGNKKDVSFGEIVNVGKSFLVIPKTGYRVNVIGFVKSGVSDESGIPIRRNDILKRFSVDKKGLIYRIEIYREKKFSGMVLVNFGGKQKALRASAPWKISQLSLLK